jgi:TolA-binding protein
VPQVGPSQRRTRRRPVLRAGLVVALSLLLGGCAYFNTFYHAKKYYAQGERARIAAEKKGQIAANNEAYKKCIDKCKRLIETYPDSKWQDDAHLLMAKAAYGRQDYLSAETTLRRFQEKFPDSELLPEALYWTGLTAYGDEDYPAARTTWQNLLERYPDYNDRESVEFYLAEAAWKGDEVEAATTAFEEFLRRYPDGNRSTEARLDLAQLLMDNKQYDKASAILGYITSKGKVEEDRLKAQMLWGEALEAQHKDEDALDLYVNLEVQLDPNVLKGRLDPALRQQAREEELARQEAARQDSLLNVGFLSDSLQTTDGSIEPAPGSDGIAPPLQSQPQPQVSMRRDVNDVRQRQLGQTMLREGSVLVRLEKPLEAIEVFQQVVSEFSSTALAAEAQYRIAYVYEVFLQDFVRAQQEYGLVSRHGQSAFREAADTRAKNLSTVRNLQASAPGDSLSQAAAAAAEARFMRAELYLFSQEDPERALEEYHAIETEFAGTEHAAKAGLAIAWVDRNSLGDSTAAMAKYAEVAERYPGTEYGRRAGDVVHGPEKEPDPLELAGPTLQQLRDPENLALLSPEAEAALSRMDEDVAQAQAQREAQRQAQAEARAAGTPAAQPVDEGALSLGGMVEATPGMRTSPPGTDATPPGSVGGTTPGSEGVLVARDDADRTAGETAATTPEPANTVTEPAAPEAAASTQPDSGEAEAAAATEPDSGETGTPPAATPDPSASSNPTVASNVTPPNPGVPASNAGPPKPNLRNPAALPADEPFFWERAGTTGPNPLMPVTGEALPGRTIFQAPTTTRETPDADTVPGHLLRVPRGLYLDPLAVPPAPGDSAAVSRESTGNGEDR